MTDLVERFDKLAAHAGAKALANTPRDFGTVPLQLNHVLRKIAGSRYSGIVLARNRVSERVSAFVQANDLAPVLPNERAPAASGQRVLVLSPASR